MIERTEQQLTKSKPLIKEGIDKFGEDSLESALVLSFLNFNNFSTKNNFLLEILSCPNSSQAYEFLKGKINLGSLENLQTVFELMSENNFGETGGIVYTPKKIVEYIVNTTIDRKGRVMDLSCGIGAFELGAIKRLKSITDLTMKEIVETYIFGVDVSYKSVKRAKILITLQLLMNGEDYESISFNLEVADSMILFNRSIADYDFKIKRPGFDFVIGNPPYIKFQDLPNHLRKRLSVGWSSVSGFNFNLYFVFIEIGLNLLNENGKLGYIVPNNLFTTFAAKNLRSILHNGRKISKIVNFNHLKVFPDAQTYTCIIIIDMAHNEKFFEYAYVEEKSYLSNLESLNFEQVFFDTLDDKKWRLISEKDHENIKKIEQIGTPIGKMFKIRVGFATLKDQVFFAKDFSDEYCITMHKEKQIKIERGITRRVVKIPLVNNEDDVKNNKLRIIFPYRNIGNGHYRIIPEEEIKQKYPLCYSYLLTRKEELSRRDKGKNTAEKWYAYGRTQGFNSYGPRLYTRTFSKGPNFIRDDDDSLYCNGYAIFIDQDIEVYQKILNSELMNYYVKKTSSEIDGDYQCYQKNYIETFSIPSFSPKELDFLRNHTDQRDIVRFLEVKYGISIS